MDVDEVVGLFPVSIDDEERQLHMAILQSLRDPKSEEESSHNDNEPDSLTASESISRSATTSYSRASTSLELSRDAASEFDKSPQMILRRSLSMDNGNPPRSVLLTDCCEVKNALLLKNREYIKCLVTSWGKMTSPIHTAVRKGHDFCLDSMLTSFPDLINSTNNNGETPLYLAAIHAKPRAIKQLLQFQADPNIGRNSLETPLLAAVDNDHPEIVLCLLKAGAKVNKSLNRGWTVLHESVYRDHSDILGILLRHGGDPNIRDGFGISPVFTSAACGRNECLKMLLQAGGDPNLCSKTKTASPLYEACKEGHSACVKTLLSSGADPHLVNCDGIYPIHIASYRGYDEIVERLLSVTDRTLAECCGMSPIHSAAKGDHVDILEMLIDHGYDVNIKLTKDKITYRDRRQTALFFAVYNDSEETTKMLLEAGADTELDYVKPLLVAVSHSQYDMADLLLSYGADVNASFNEDGANFPATIAFAMRDFSVEIYSKSHFDSLIFWCECLPTLPWSSKCRIRMLKQVLVSGCDVLSCLSCEIGDRNHLNFDEKIRRKSFCHFLTEDNHLSWCGCTLLYLLQFVGNIKICHRVLEVVKESDEWPLIQKLTESPRSLQHLCRLTIRDSLGCRRVRDENAYKSLPIPQPIMEYLIFSEI